MLTSAGLGKKNEQSLSVLQPERVAGPQQKRHARLRANRRAIGAKKPCKASLSRIRTKPAKPEGSGCTSLRIIPSDGLQPLPYSGAPLSSK
jgi:hypothetical protein